jgi:predicted nucleic acid-binding protein
MIVVADTSPLNYLVLIDEIELLAALFEKVLLPNAVLKELQHPRTPEKVCYWAAHFPTWIEVKAVDMGLIHAL